METDIREVVEALRQLQQATANWAAMTNAPVEVAQALYTGRQVLNAADAARRVGGT